MKIELTKFRVKSGKTERVTEWLSFLRTHKVQVEKTLVDEQMFVETIFREFREDGEYMYWYSVQGEGGSCVEDSQHWVDREHLKYWRECIDEAFMPVDMVTEVVMLHPKIGISIDEVNDS
ncbi:MAG: DUF6176 family protein [Bacilli bacterium]